MTGQIPARCAKRVFVRLPAWVVIGSDKRKSEHVAFVRDISPRGVFFYSDWSTTQGTKVEFVLEYLSGTNRVRLHLSGSVVRTERGSSAPVFGIAVAFDEPCVDVPRAPIRVK